MYLDARRPIIYIRNFDFQAVDRLIEDICQKDYVIEEYSEAGGRLDFRTKSPKGKGYMRLDEYLALYNSSQFEHDKHRYLVVLKEIHTHLEEPQTYTILQSIAQRVKRSDEDQTHENNYDVTIVIVDSKLTIPPELEKLITLIEVHLPNDEEIAAIVKKMAEINYAEIAEGFMPELVMALKGLSEFEIKQIVNLAIANSGRLYKDSISLIHQEKRQAIQKSGLVEMIDVGNEQIGGLKKLRSFLSMNAPIFKNPGLAQEYGVSIPAGVMIVGMPGCGKSLTAKCIAKEFGVPLLRLDVGRLMGKYVGESEENLRRAIAVAESAAPCILWIDEIEKAFAGIGDAGGGSVMTRMFGYFLTWMQEKKSCIYVVATANDISNLPPEFLRRGRFDEIFQVKFPNLAERKEIFGIQIRKRNHGEMPDGVNASKLAMMLSDEQNYSGADIDSMVKEAMKRVFVDNIQRFGEDKKEKWRTLTMADMEAVIKDTPSSYHSQKAKLDKMLEKLRELDVKPAS